MNQPHITIITVCFNALEALKRTMASVFAQTYANLEYIIIDGASTDGTVDFLKQEASSHMFKWLSEADKGIYDAMNKGIMMATGDYLLFMNAGDTFATDVVVDTLFSVPRDADVIYGDVVKSAADGSDTVKKAEEPHNAHRMYFCHQCVFTRRTCLQEYPFDIRHAMSADFKQFKQLYKAGKTFERADLPIARFDTGGISNTNRSAGIHDNITVIREVDSLADKLRLLPRLYLVYFLCRMRGK